MEEKSGLEEYYCCLKVLILCIASENMVISMRPINLDSNDRTISVKKRETDNSNNNEPDQDEPENVTVVEESINFKKRMKLAKVELQTTVLCMNPLADSKNYLGLEEKVDNNDLAMKVDMKVSSPKQQAYSFSSSPANDDQLDTAATKLQKFYKSYRTRRNLADCAVVVEELWWKELESAALRRSSVSFFNSNKRETAISRWKRAKTRAAKVGKGLSRDAKAQKLALRHWLEAIDPRHRYGHNLHMYYDIWFGSESNQPFFYWLDIGDGKELNLEKCPRTDLQHQCIKYLGPKEREAYEVVMESGMLVYRQSRVLVDTIKGSKWIFVLSTSRNFYVGEKKKGSFQHSSFLAGGTTIASGRLVARNGVLEAIWPFSGHYRPTEESFIEFCNFLEDHHVDLTNVKKSPTDDDIPPKVTDKELKPDQSIIDSVEIISSSESEATDDVKEHAKDTAAITDVEKLSKNGTNNVEEPPVRELGTSLSHKWTTGAGPRISCVRDYPRELKFHALEQVNLSPSSSRVKPAPFTSCGPIPSPRPSPKIHLSSRLAFIGL